MSGLQTDQHDFIDEIRYAYVKNGDVVAQFERILAAGAKKITSGPDAFIYDFLQAVQNNPKLLLSRSTRNALFQKDESAVKARVFMERGPHLGRLLQGPVSTIRIFLHLLLFRPQRILCGTTGGPLWACFVISKIFSSPLVHSRHNRVSSNAESWHRKLSLCIDRWCICRLQAVICHGPFLKQELLDVGVPKHRIFEFDVSFDDLLKCKQEDLIASYYTDLIDSRFILYFGRIETNKGIFDLLTAYIEILKEDSSLQLVYVGTGSQIETLKAKIEKAGLSKKVLLLGKVPHDDLVHIIKLSIAVVTPTRSDFPEGRCMAAMESLVMGVPVIAPNFGPFPYLINHGLNGLLYIPDSVQDLKLKISNLLSDNDLYMNLSEGACKSGKQLMNSVSFSQAVKNAFSLKDVN